MKKTTLIIFLAIFLGGTGIASAADLTLNAGERYGWASGDNSSGNVTSLQQVITPNSDMASVALYVSDTNHEFLESLGLLIYGEADKAPNDSPSYWSRLTLGMGSPNQYKIGIDTFGTSHVDTLVVDASQTTYGLEIQTVGPIGYLFDNTGLFPYTSVDLGRLDLPWHNGYFSSTVFSRALKLDPGAASRPTCDSSQRGVFWTTYGASGVKDTVAVCAKSATNAYAWRTIY